MTFSGYKGAGFQRRYGLRIRAPLHATALILKMYFFAFVAFAALPFLVDAVPVSLKSSRTGSPISIPLTKRSNLWNNQGFVDLDKR